MCTSSTSVTKYLFALATQAKTTERLERSPKDMNIYNLSGCAHQQIPQQSDDKRTDLHLCCELQRVFPFTGYFNLSIYLLVNFNLSHSQTWLVFPVMTPLPTQQLPQSIYKIWSNTNYNKEQIGTAETDCRDQKSPLAEGSTPWLTPLIISLIIFKQGGL